MLELRRLRLLSELERRGTIAAVAAALSYSPSTVSQQLSLLEIEAGVKLLEPVGRRVRLTPQAHILVTHANAILSQLEKADAEIAQSLETLTGTLRVATFQSVFLSVLPGAIADLQAQHPQLRIEVFQGEPEASLPQLLAHDYDLVVAEEYPGRPVPRTTGIDWEELCTDPLRFAVPPDFDADASDEDLIAYLAQHAWVGEPVGTASRNWLVDLCRRLGFEPDFRYSTDDLLVHCRLVQAGHAVAVLPDLLASASGDHPRLVDVPGPTTARRILTASRRVAAAHPAVQACRQALKAQLA